MVMVPFVRGSVISIRRTAQGDFDIEAEDLSHTRGPGGCQRQIQVAGPGQAAARAALRLATILVANMLNGLFHPADTADRHHEGDRARNPAASDASIWR
jgi:hypothetical protein